MRRPVQREFLQELLRAGASGRLGIKRPEVMEWLLRFAQIDLKNLSQGDWRNLIFEIASFVQHGGRHAEHEETEKFFCLKKWDGKPYGSKPPQELQLAALRHAFNVYQDAFSNQPSLPSQKDIHLLQVKAKGALTGIIDQGVIVLQSPPSTQYFSFWPASKTDPPPLVQSMTLTESPTDLFTKHLLDFLKEFIALLNRCPECSNIFLLKRTNKKYCSLKCQNRINVRQYQEKIGRSKSGKKKKSNPKHPKRGSQ